MRLYRYFNFHYLELYLRIIFVDMKIGKEKI